MNYKKMIKQIAKENGTSFTEVEREIRKAIKATGLNISPKKFIELTTRMVENEIRNTY